MIRTGDVFKPVNVEGKTLRSLPSRSPADATSPCTPPRHQAVHHAPASSVCETPRLSKLPSENSVARKRVFGFVGDGDAPSTTPAQVDGGCEEEAEAPQEELRSARPTRQCKEQTIKRMRSDDPSNPNNVDDDDISDRATPSRDSSRRSDVSSGGNRASAASSDTRNKGPCTYEHCPNPNHSSGGGFKVVSMETKAGNRDWSCYAGRTFCNACFTQFATRGTLQRPGRLINPPAIAAPMSHGGDRTPSAECSTKHSHDRAAVAYAPPRPAQLRTTVVVEDDVDEETEAAAVVELELTVSGRDVEYQWIHDGRMIQGATHSMLLLENPKGIRGEITCRVSNHYGVLAPFAPIRLPLSISEAKKRYTKPVMPPASAYQLTCVCGRVRKGTPLELVVPCECGLEVCGEIEPLYSKEEKAQLKAMSFYDDMGEGAY